MSSTYNNTKELRFWCQKVLPLVYDDSLSYYELLNKIVVYLNSTIEDVQAMIADVTRIEQGLSSKIDTSQKGVANGVATLDGHGQVPLTQLPDISAGVQTISVNGVNVPADDNKNVNIIVMTNAVSNLVNYYLKSETYNKTEVNALIDNVKNSRFEVVAQLPTTNIQTNVIYLVPKSVGQTQNGYDEFINVDGTTSGWELIGSTDIDLSGYVTDSELATALSAYVTTQSLNTTLAGYVTSGALATTLQNYVQNSTFNALVNRVSDIENVIPSSTSASNPLVDNDTLSDELSNKQDLLIFDDKPTNNSNNPVTSNGVFNSVVANTKLIKDTVGWSGKNKLYQYTNVSQTYEGLTFTKNSDNSVSISGTFTGSAFASRGIGKITVSAGTHKFIVNGRDFDNNKFTIQIYDATHVAQLANYDTAGDHLLEFTVNEETEIEYRIGLRTGGTIPSGQSVTYYPMIRNADILDDSYEPYFGSTAFPRSEQRVLGAKNRLNAKFKNSNTPNITITPTYDDKGSLEYVTLNGTSDTEQIMIQFAARLDGDLILPKGNYKFSIGTSNANIKLQVGRNSSGPTSGSYVLLAESAYGDGELQFTIDEPYGLTVQIFAKANSSFDNVKIYPMVYDASDPDDTYVPYAMTNKELTENKVSKTLDTIDSTKDLDDYKETGFYAISSSPAHAPESISYVFMDIRKREANNNVRQIIYGSSAIYLRSFNGTTWGNWYKFTGTALS